MPLMGFQKKKYLDRGVGGWVELYPNYFWIFGIFLTLQSPLEQRGNKCPKSQVDENVIIKLTIITQGVGLISQNLNDLCQHKGIQK